MKRLFCIALLLQGFFVASISAMKYSQYPVAECTVGAKLYETIHANQDKLVVAGNESMPGENVTCFLYLLRNMKSVGLDDRSDNQVLHYEKLVSFELSRQRFNEFRYEQKIKIEVINYGAFRVDIDATKKPLTTIQNNLYVPTKPRGFWSVERAVSLGFVALVAVVSWLYLKKR